MSVIDPDRGIEESFPLELLSYSFIWDGAMTSDGHILVPSITMGPRQRNVLRVYDLTMTLIDSLPLPDPPIYNRTDPPGAFYWEAPGGRGMGFVQVPSYPFGVRLLDPSGGIWSTATGDFGYRINYWQAGGDTLLILTTQRRPVAIPESERDSLVNTVREQLLRYGAADQDYSKVPKVRPSVVSAFIAEDGHLWAETPDSAGGTIYDRYDRDGAYLGSVASHLKTAYGMRPVVRGNQLWAVVTDDLGVHYVVRHRIVPSTTNN